MTKSNDRKPDDPRGDLSPTLTPPDQAAPRPKQAGPSEDQDGGEHGSGELGSAGQDGGGHDSGTNELEGDAFAMPPPTTGFGDGLLAYASDELTPPPPPRSDVDLTHRLPPNPSISDDETGRFCDGAPEVEGYRVLAPLGRGGMGTVWRAMQLGTQRPVALKLIEVDDRAPIELFRFFQEVQINARLDHPNIARIYDSRLYEGVYCYAMELIEGKTLLQHVKSNELGDNDRIRLLVKVFRAMDFAHGQGVMHRDLKPSNIMVNEEGEPKIVDFGLAKVYRSADGSRADSELTVEGDAVGTPAYMSPEQAMGQSEKIDHRADIWSLGVILYMMLTGEHPFGLEGTSLQLMMRVIHNDVTPPRDHRPDLPPDLDAILRKVLERNPDKRYQSAGAIADDLEAYLNGEVVKARRRTPIYVFSRAVRRYRIAIGLSLAAISLVSAMLVGRVDYERSLSKTIIDGVADNAREDLREFFDDAAGTLRTIRDWGETGLFDPEDIDQANRVLAPVIGRHQAITSLNTGDAEGNGYMILKGQSKWRTREVHRDREGWGARTRWQTFAKPTQIDDIEDRDMDYDPRTRPWYQTASMHEDHAGEAEGEHTDDLDVVCWTEPYAFFTTGDPGITAATWVEPEGRAPFVVAVDIMLRDLSKFTSRLEVGENGQVFVTTEDGRMLGLPRIAPADKKLLEPAKQSGLSVISGFAKKWSPPADGDASDHAAPPVFEFQAGNERWWGGVRPFSLGEGEPMLWIGVAVPHSDLTGKVNRRRVILWGGSALALAIVALTFSWRRRGPVIGR